MELDWTHTVKSCPRVFGAWALFDDFGSTNSHNARGIKHNLYNVKTHVRGTTQAWQI